jgi:hypothetical protein
LASTLPKLKSEPWETPRFLRSTAISKRLRTGSMMS